MKKKPSWKKLLNLMTSKAKSNETTLKAIIAGHQIYIDSLKKQLKDKEMEIEAWELVEKGDDEIRESLIDKLRTKDKLIEKVIKAWKDYQKERPIPNSNRVMEFLGKFDDMLKDLEKSIKGE